MSNRSYDRVGVEAMSDAELEATIAEWQADNPGETAVGVRARCSRYGIL